MITPQMLQQTPGVWYVETKLFNSTWEPGLTLKTTSFMSKCLYWHVERQTWSSDGCQVNFHLDKANLVLKCFFLITHISFCLRWVRKALRSEHSVCVTTSLSLGVLFL